MGVGLLVPGQSLGGKRPAGLWLRALTGLSIFLYSTLDNVDGKQARKTGTASPLGLIFDHGCDGLATGLVGVLSVQLLGFPGLQACVISFLFCVCFYAKTVEHNATGVLDLGRVNIVDEGLPFIALVCVLSAQVAHGLAKEAFLGLLWRDAAFIALTAMSGAMIWSSAAAVLHARGVDWAVEAICVYMVLLASGLLQIVCSAAPGGSVLVVFVCLHARLTAELIVSHVCGMTPASWLPYPLGLAVAAGCLGLLELALPRSASRWLRPVLHLHAGLCALYLLLFACTLTRSIARVLGVRVLHIPSARE